MDPTFAAVPDRGEGSVRSELGAEDRRDVLTLTQQPNHIQMVVAFKVEPQQRKPFDLPDAKTRNAQATPQHWRPDARLEFDLVKRGIGCLDQPHCHPGPGFAAVVTRFTLLVP